MSAATSRSLPRLHVVKLIERLHQALSYVAAVIATGGNRYDLKRERSCASEQPGGQVGRCVF
jgi:hypothetical protein